MNPHRAPMWPIAGARAVIALLWLFSLRWKLPPDFAPNTGRGLMDWLQLEVEYGAFDLYVGFVESVVLPNFTVFAWAIFLGELMVGLLLLTGTWTRLAAVIGLLMSLNLGIGLLDVPGEWPWSYAMLAMWHGLFWVAAAGRLWGVDQLFWRRWPHAAWLRWLA